MYCNVDLIVNGCNLRRTANDVSYDHKLAANRRLFNGRRRLTADELIYFSKNCDSFSLNLCAPSTILAASSKNDSFGGTNAGYDGECFAHFDFLRNRDLLGDKLRDNLSKPEFFNECGHYESVDADGAHSSLSICSLSEITGILRVNGRPYQFFFTEPTNRFAINSMDVLPSVFTCDILYAKKTRARRRRAIENDGKDDKRTVVEPQLPAYYRNYLDGVRRYVELVFIADNSMYIKYNKDAAKIHDRLQSIAGIVNSLYAPLNIRVTLVWADIWMSGDAVEVNSEADRTLSRFVAYRKASLLAEHPNDNAQLITDVRFGEVIGKAYRGTMCSYEYSGGVIVDHSPNVAFVGGTLAHEMGHNFGMDHDSGYPNPCACAAYQCIMAPASSTINATTYFSDCSLEALDKALKRGVDYCLRNVPEIAFGGAKCGNGVVEAGEECDCGSTKACPNRCCVPATCRLAADAECADGECCDVQTCQPKSSAKVCRDATNSCDLPEFCDGQNPICPPDFFVQNGLECPNDTQGFCYDGHCGSRNQQCQMIWGPAGENSVAQCYAYNRDGTFSGNCGYEPNTNRYLPCRNEDIQCGRLQCRHSAEKPMFGDPSAVFSAYNYVRLSDGREVSCRSVRTTYSDGGSKSGRKLRDPGMVPDGAKCGDGKICIDAQCRNYTEVTQMVTRCEPPDCNGKGICNNVGNCHCVPGYGGPGCDIPGYGGSLNSGPATDTMYNPGLVLAYLMLVGLIVFAFATYYCKRHKNFWLHKKIWRFVKNTLNIRSTVRVPVRRAPPIPNVVIQHTHRFSFAALWGDATHGKNHPPTQHAPTTTIAGATLVATGGNAFTATAAPARQLAANNSTAALLSNASPTSSVQYSIQPPSSTVYAVGAMDHYHSDHYAPGVTSAMYQPQCAVKLVSPSASSSSASANEAPDVAERKPLQHASQSSQSFVSSRKLMEEIKRNIENPESLKSSKSSSAIVSRPVEMSFNGATATSKYSRKPRREYDRINDDDREAESAQPPPPPPHRTDAATTTTAALGSGSATSKPPPVKPKMAVRPIQATVTSPVVKSVNKRAAKLPQGKVAAQLKMFERNDSAAGNDGVAEKSNAEKPLNVRQLTAKFNAPQ